MDERLEDRAALLSRIEVLERGLCSVFFFLCFRYFRTSFTLSQIKYKLIWISTCYKFLSCDFCFVERNELRSDIEQMCMQHAGPSYAAVATRMHFQRYIIIQKLWTHFPIVTIFNCDINTQLGQLVWSRK